MNLIRLILYDIRHGIVRNLLFYIPAVAVIILECMAYAGLAKEVDKTITLSAGDYMLNLFSGMERYIPGTNVPFSLPFLWIVYYFYFSFIICAYPRKELEGYGKYILLRCGRRLNWWISKVVYVCASAVFFYAVTLAASFTFGAMGGNATFFPTKEATEALFRPEFLLAGETDQIITSILMPFLVLVTSALLQLFLMLVLGTLLAFFMINALYIAAAYFSTPLFPGEYAMVLRSRYVAPDGFDTGFGMVLMLCIITVAIALGAFVFRRCDILPKKDEEE